MLTLSLALTHLFGHFSPGGSLANTQKTAPGDTLTTARATETRSPTSVAHSRWHTHTAVAVPWRTPSHWTDSTRNTPTLYPYAAAHMHFDFFLFFSFTMVALREWCADFLCLNGFVELLFLSLRLGLSFMEQMKMYEFTVLFGYNRTLRLKFTLVFVSHRKPLSMRLMSKEDIA